MPNFTKFLKLEKPLQTEQYNVDVFNANSDKVDLNLEDVNTRLDMSADIVMIDNGITTIWHPSGYMEVFGIVDSGSVVEPLHIIYPDAFDLVPTVIVTYNLTDQPDTFIPNAPAVVSDVTISSFRVPAKENVKYNWYAIGSKLSKPVFGYIAVKPTSLVLTMGESYSLIADVQGFESDVTWESLDTGICIVNSSGIVTGVGIGGTLIKVSSVVGGKTALCMIAVRRMDL